MSWLNICMLLISYKGICNEGNVSYLIDKSLVFTTNLPEVKQITVDTLKTLGASVSLGSNVSSSSITLFNQTVSNPLLMCNNIPIMVDSLPVYFLVQNKNNYSLSKVPYSNFFQIKNDKDSIDDLSTALQTYGIITQSINNTNNSPLTINNALSNNTYATINFGSSNVSGDLTLNSNISFSALDEVKILFDMTFQFPVIINTSGNTTIQANVIADHLACSSLIGTVPTFNVLKWNIQSVSSPFNPVNSVIFQGDMNFGYETHLGNTTGNNSYMGYFNDSQSTANYYFLIIDKENYLYKRRPPSNNFFSIKKGIHLCDEIKFCNREKGSVLFIGNNQGVIFFDSQLIKLTGNLVIAKKEPIICEGTAFFDTVFFQNISFPSIESKKVSITGNKIYIESLLVENQLIFDTLPMIKKPHYYLCKNKIDKGLVLLKISSVDNKRREKISRYEAQTTDVLIEYMEAEKKFLSQSSLFKNIIEFSKITKNIAKEKRMLYLQYMHLLSKKINSQSFEKIKSKLCALVSLSLKGTYE